MFYYKSKSICFIKTKYSKLLLLYFTLSLYFQVLTPGMSSSVFVVCFNHVISSLFHIHVVSMFIFFIFIPHSSSLYDKLKTIIIMHISNICDESLFILKKFDANILIIGSKCIHFQVISVKTWIDYWWIIATFKCCSLIRQVRTMVPTSLKGSWSCCRAKRCSLYL